MVPLPPGPGKLSLDPCPWKSLHEHTEMPSSITTWEGGHGAVPFFGVSQFLYPVSCWHWFWSLGITSGAGQSFVDWVCGFFGHAITSETWQASGLFVQAVLRGPPLPRVLIKSPWTKATVFCCVHFLLSRRSSGGATLQPPEDGHPLTLAPTCAEDARELAPMCAEDACELCWSPVSPMVSDCCFSQIHLGYKCN